MFENFGERVPKNMQSNGDIENIQNTDNVKGKRKKKGIKGRSKEEAEGTESTIDLQEDTSNVLDKPRKGREVDRGRLDKYLEDIGRFPLLTPEEEIFLAVRIKENNQRASELIERANKLTEEARKLPEGDSRRIKIEEDAEQAKKDSEQAKKDSEQAKEKFVNANLRLVVFVAKLYRGYYGIPFLDLIQGGNLGLARAVEKFDYKRGNKFSTYAIPVIRKEIVRTINKWSRSISIPTHIQHLLPKIGGAKKEYFSKFGKMPTPEYLAEKLGKTVKQIIRAENMASIRVSSLDAPVSIGDVNGSTREDFIEGELVYSESKGDEVSTGFFREELERALEHLADRKKKIFRLRHGLEEDGHFYTFAEIGDKFGITKQRANQIVKEALAELLQKNPQLKKTLEEFLRPR